MKYIVSIYNISTLKKVKDLIDGAIISFPTLSQVYENDANVDLMIDYCEKNKITPILNISKLFLENDLKEAKNFIKKYQKYDYLATDLGILEIFKELNMLDKVIYDSSTMVCNSLDLRYYQNLGLSAVSMSNEIPVSDVIKAYKDTGADIMYQVFGRKLMFYSKRKLLNCYEDHRNISLPRNNLYIKEEKREELMPIVENDNGFFVYRSYFISLFKEMANLSFLKYAYFESLTLSDDELYSVLKAYRENKEDLLNNLLLNIQDGFAYSDTIHVKEKIINEKN